MDYTISGTEIGAILGLNPYQTPMDLYMRKLGLIDPPIENEAMKWGSAAEHVVARRYARETHFELSPSIDEGYDYKSPFTHPNYPWWVGTPDRKIYAQKSNYTPDNGLLEIKIVGERMAHQWGDPPDGDVPEQYLTQIAWYMPLLDVEWADLAVQIGNRDYRVYRINRDREFEDTLRDAALAFINDHLIPQVPPPIDGSESSKRYLNYRYPVEREPLLDVTGNGEIQVWVNSYRKAKEQLRTAEGEVAEIENFLKNIIGETAGLTGPFGKVTWTRNKDSKVVDAKAIAKAYPEIAEKFTITRPGARVFRAYLKED